VRRGHRGPPHHCVHAAGIDRHDRGIVSVGANGDDGGAGGRQVRFQRAVPAGPPGAERAEVVQREAFDEAVAPPVDRLPLDLRVVRSDGDGVRAGPRHADNHVRGNPVREAQPFLVPLAVEVDPPPLGHGVVGDRADRPATAGQPGPAILQHERGVALFVHGAARRGPEVERVGREGETDPRGRARGGGEIGHRSGGRAELEAEAVPGRVPALPLRDPRGNLRRVELEEEVPLPTRRDGAAAVPRGLFVVSGRDDDDEVLLGHHPVVGRLEEGRAVVRAHRRPLALVDDHRAAEGVPLLQHVPEAVDRADRPLVPPRELPAAVAEEVATAVAHDDQVGVRRDAAELAVRERGAVADRDPGDVRAVPPVVDELPGLPRVDLRLRVLDAVRVPGRRGPRGEVVPHVEDPALPLVVEEVRVGDVDAVVHQAVENAGPGVAERRAPLVDEVRPALRDRGVQHRGHPVGGFDRVDPRIGGDAIEVGSAQAGAHDVADARVGRGAERGEGRVGERRADQDGEREVVRLRPEHDDGVAHGPQGGAGLPGAADGEEDPRIDLGGRVRRERGENGCDPRGGESFPPALDAGAGRAPRRQRAEREESQDPAGRFSVCLHGSVSDRSCRASPRSIRSGRQPASAFESLCRNASAAPSKVG